MHVNIKSLPKLQTINDERRKRYLYVASDRWSRSVYLAVNGDEIEKGAIACLREAACVFTFPLTHALTDNGNCFTSAVGKVCTSLRAAYRLTTPQTLQTNGMLERFNGLWQASRQTDSFGGAAGPRMIRTWPMVGGRTG